MIESFAWQMGAEPARVAADVFDRSATARWPTIASAGSGRWPFIPPPESMRSGGRVVEGARLESEYTAKPYRGFESLPLRQSADTRTSAPAPIGPNGTIAGTKPIFSGGCAGNWSDDRSQDLRLARARAPLTAQRTSRGAPVRHNSRSTPPARLSNRSPTMPSPPWTAKPS